MKTEFRALFGNSLALATAILSLGWGGTGHRIINARATCHLPSSMVAWIADSSYFASHGSDADNRKGSDPTEAPKHYIDLENYGDYSRLTPNLDSIVAVYGWPAVEEIGILPWATVRAYDSLVAQLRRRDMTKARLTASDIGHYVGDAHQPLHNTVNYNGQYTGNGGIHSRYESGLINDYSSQLGVVPGGVAYVADRFSFALTQSIMANALVDSILLADNLARTVTGWDGSGTPPAGYYPLLWHECQSFTSTLFQDATIALASLWYSAWVDAGLIAPTTVPDEAGELPQIASLGQNYPNPFNPATTIRFAIGGTRGRGPGVSNVRLVMYDLLGREVNVLVDQEQASGSYEVRVDAARLSTGAYFYRLTAGQFVETRKMILAR